MPALGRSRQRDQLEGPDQDGEVLGLDPDEEVEQELPVREGQREGDYDAEDRARCSDGRNRGVGLNQDVDQACSAAGHQVVLEELPASPVPLDSEPIIHRKSMLKKM